LTNFLIGRQPIYDRQHNVFAYELLFRDEHHRAPALSEGTRATNQIIVDTLLEHGLHRIVGSHRAFINFTRENILEGTPLLLPKDRVVVEVLESVAIDETLIDAVRDLSRQGYMISLDDFQFSEEWVPLLRLADFVKLDVQLFDELGALRCVQRLKPFALKLLAEKVESEEHIRYYKSLGCQYFQGYYFQRPHIVHGKRVDSARQASVRLLAEINRPDIDLDELCAVIAQDVGISYKLLRYINSSFFSLPGKVDSIQRAVMLLGLMELKRWTSLIALSNVPGKPKELIHTALVRAKMCDLLAGCAGEKKTDQYFLAGMLSILDQLLDSPLAEVLQGLPLTATLMSALLEQEGEIGATLHCTLHYERWELDAVIYRDFNPQVIGEIYLASVAWANEVMELLN
jgi:EAL and modified HD-GYP domain-containing signal transduction protein